MTVQNSEDDPCPICGQEYDYKREDVPVQLEGELRSDATACKTAKDHSKRDWYIHVRERNVNLHRKKVPDGRRGTSFPCELPDGANVVEITEKSGGSPAHVYYTVPDGETDE